jgi:mannose-6-phosphate isomerase-like protein (cupin superfamily)
MTTLELGPGVVVRIPAGVPHVIRPLGAAPLVYLVLKEQAAGKSK